VTWTRRIGRAVLHGVAAAFYVSGAAWLLIHVRRLVSSSPRVHLLSYHHVGRPEDVGPAADAVDAATFEAHLRLLTRWFDVIGLDEAAKRLWAGVGRDAVVVTFDDGYEDNYSVAAPILERYRVPASVFLVTGLIGTRDLPWYDEYAARLRFAMRSDWHERGRARDTELVKELKHRLRISPHIEQGIAQAVALLKTADAEEVEKVLQKLRLDTPGYDASDTVPRFRMLTWSEVRRMAEQGIRFGSHTVHHPVLTQIGPDALASELVESRQAIEGQVGQTCTSLAFPNGDHSPAVIEAARQAGYRLACTQTFGVNRPGSSLLTLKRIPVGNISAATLALRLTGLVTPIFAARDRWRQLWLRRSRLARTRRPLGAASVEVPSGKA
jgi:peptidoglycan/xylan/chitin deacetylase (PgdA/CDA1 family)